MEKMAFVACFRKGHKPGIMLDPVILTDLGAATSLVLMLWNPMVLEWKVHTSCDLHNRSHAQKLALKKKMEEQGDKLHNQLMALYDQDPEKV